VVHEAYLALVDQATATWNDRAHFCAVATRVIRHVLIDHARRRGARKRGGGDLRVPPEDDLDPGEEDVLHHTRTGIQPLTLEDASPEQVIERTPSSCQAALADADRLLEQMRRSGTTQGAWQEDGCPGT
jgi:DNA-directed RNA polymerase specialized sigma24 family protein